MFTRRQHPMYSLSVKRFIILFVILLSSPQFTNAGQYHVIRVIDGDTIDVDDLKNKFTARLVGIDAPELGKGKYDQSQPFARTAENQLTSFVGNRIIDLKSYGADRYHRPTKLGSARNKLI
jgi:micrococcal nuclease